MSPDLLRETYPSIESFFRSSGLNSSNSNGHPPSSTTFHLLKPQLESSKESSKEGPSNSDTPESSPERTEEEFVPEAPEITYQFTGGDEDQHLASLDLAGVQLFLIIFECSVLISQLKGLLLADPVQWMPVAKEIPYLKPGHWLGNNSIDWYLLQHWHKVKGQSPMLYINPYHTTLCSPHKERIADLFKEGLYSYLRVAWCPWNL